MRLKFSLHTAQVNEGDSSKLMLTSGFSQVYKVYLCLIVLLWLSYLFSTTVFSISYLPIMEAWFMAILLNPFLWLFLFFICIYPFYSQITFDPQKKSVYLQERYIVPYLWRYNEYEISFSEIKFSYDDFSEICLYSPGILRIKIELEFLRTEKSKDALLHFLGQHFNRISPQPLLQYRSLLSAYEQDCLNKLEGFYFAWVAKAVRWWRRFFSYTSLAEAELRNPPDYVLNLVFIAIVIMVAVSLIR